MERVAEKIRKICKDKGISVTTLEKKAGIANGLVGKWEESSPNVISLRKVAAILDVTIDELLEA